MLVILQSKKKINWKKREKELLKLLDKHRKNNGDYDCLVPGSGGKDSVFAAHILKYKYGMHPLTTHGHRFCIRTTAIKILRTGLLEGLIILHLIKMEEQ